MCEVSKEQSILDSWHKNAEPWVGAITNNEIESRVLITNQSILDVMTQYGGRSVLDIGCGEGWLVRELAKLGYVGVGIDGVPGLIEEAQKQGGGDFFCVKYEDLLEYPFADSFDVAVCNFSLIGKLSVAAVFRSMSGILSEQGFFVVQTLHPRSTHFKNDYSDGWRVGSWDGFNSAFTDPAPWYFRTVESWVELFKDAGLNLIEIKEPKNPITGEHASIIMIGQKH